MLDLFTALTIWCLAAFTIAAVLLTLWLRDRGSTFYLWLGGGFLASASGVALVALRGAIPDWLSIGVGNGVMMSSMTLWILGVHRFNGWTLRGRPLAHAAALLPVLVYLGIFLDLRFYETLWLRQLFINGGAVPGHLLLAHALWPRSREASRSRRPMALIFLGVAAWSALATAGVAWFRPLALADYPLSWANGIVSLLVLLVMMTFGAKVIRERDDRRLQRLALSDPLTGVLNRRGLFAELPRFSGGGQTGGQAGGVALLLFDLDHFKRINDRHGHHAGDCVLLAFCRLMEACLPPGTPFGRLGGEEFAALVPVRDAGEAVAVAERARAALARRPVMAEGVAIPVTVSVGVALLPAPCRDLRGPLETADRALYAAKAAGRNQVSLGAALPFPDPAVAQRA